MAEKDWASLGLPPWWSTNTSASLGMFEFTDLMSPIILTRCITTHISNMNSSQICRQQQHVAIGSWCNWLPHGEHKSFHNHTGWHSPRFQIRAHLLSAGLSSVCGCSVTVASVAQNCSCYWLGHLPISNLLLCIAAIRETLGRCITFIRRSEAFESARLQQKPWFQISIRLMILDFWIWNLEFAVAGGWQWLLE